MTPEIAHRCFILLIVLFHCQPRREKAMLKFITEMRILSAPSLPSMKTQAADRAASIAIATFLIEKRSLSLTIFFSGFEDGLSNRAVRAATADVAAQPGGNLIARGVGVLV